MTENPNTEPDPNVGLPPAGPPGRPTTPTEPTAAAAQPSEPARPAESTGSTRVSGGAESAEPEPARQAAADQGAAQPSEPHEPGAPAAGPAEPGTEPPVDQTPATGTFAESPWVEPTEDDTALAAPIDPNAPKTTVAATFLPGVDAASVLALVLAALAAGAFLLVNPLVQAHDAARTWSDFKNNVPRTRQDPFGLQRDWVSYQSWAHIILGLVAVLLALLVLGLWTARRNKLRSRSFAQAALVLGLAVVLYGILLKTGAVGSEIPSLKDISTGLSSSQ